MTYDLLICTGLFPPDVGGPATYSKLLLDELPKRGVKVKVLSFGEVRHLPKLVRHLSYAWRVFKLIPKANAVYAQDPVSVGLPVMIACALRRRPYFIKIVGDYAWEQGSQRFGVKDLLDEFSVQNNYRWPVRLLKKIELTVARRARKIIMPSEYLKKIISNWGVNTEKITVIYNSFDEPMEVLLEKEVLRRELGLAGQVMVSVGRLVPWKGFPMLIDLLGGELGRQYPNLKLYIIGGGPERKLLNQMVTEKGLNDRVFLTGNKLRNDVLRYLKAADIFVLNTSYEGLSHQLLEVMWCGTPIVTTRGLKENEMKKIAGWITKVIAEVEHYRLPEQKEIRAQFIKKVKAEVWKNKKLATIGKEVKQMAFKFPIFAWD